ncbi:MAG: ribonuclease III [Firmicutes bacterium]|jgi:ribonuclease-3|nr:ribonuclease III [Bacillota bacterium]
MSWPELVEQFIKTVQWEIKDRSLYEQALTHSSYAHEKGNRHRHNERLEFLGDAVLELIISDYLYFTYSQLPEGKLTRLRAELVCEASLARLAYIIGLGRFLRLGKGEAAWGGSSRPSLLADALEALIGALYLDLGFEQCREYVLKLYRPVLQDLQQGVLQQDYKTILQELIQARYAVTPEYRIVLESGPDHDKTFEAVVLIKQKAAGRGRGRSKKEAEQAAAKEAWNALLAADDAKSAETGADKCI